MAIVRLENKGSRKLTKKEREELEKAKSLPVDLSDIPEIESKEWEGATRGRFNKALSTNSALSSNKLREPKRGS